MNLKWPTKMYIGGKWVTSQEGRTLPAVNPATGETLTEVSLGGPREVDLAIAASAYRAFWHTFRGLSEIPSEGLSAKRDAHGGSRS